MLPWRETERDTGAVNAGSSHLASEVYLVRSQGPRWGLHTEFSFPLIIRHLGFGCFGDCPLRHILLIGEYFSQIAGFSSFHWKLVPSRYMRCKRTASLRVREASQFAVARESTQRQSESTT